MPEKQTFLQSKMKSHFCELGCCLAGRLTAFSLFCQSYMARLLGVAALQLRARKLGTSSGEQLHFPSPLAQQGVEGLFTQNT